MEPNRITADWHTLLRQAGITAEQYYSQAQAFIEKREREYGEELPENLVSTLIQAQALDFLATSIGVAAQRIADAIRESGPRD